MTEANIQEIDTVSTSENKFSFVHFVIEVK
ncbi:MAG: hypothetical protein UV61_C0002G0064 [Candidatus Gottesmanbacteria bacterium GW2011_GWB1_43_11]|uniref:Uncharacterized protein n=1 Tax=Candidatus Gottesmanbacteria bacterium GW2011_GWB1_43_11 TaxID=1618446 RepID=A0A0G1FKD0_9BACT|nr:MAG: hypothetical protein UV04_C0020G0009 [Candidatus Gottesmanbacteria bacterium GW2011_GWA2_42_16]KKS81850.1 MAG: hypothetical protein UV55_C0008G0065 [Candidatus Gottesmanbacteria bacterium GW2011_GWC1_43_10]KKS87343.1 MAG: hypothetical protein UV61_C0002G0064 [Candidatus Gottesmanbacteria bacterium GW2011_GWB1_43_11]